MGANQGGFKWVFEAECESGCGSATYYASTSKIDYERCSFAFSESHLFSSQPKIQNEPDSSERCGVIPSGHDKVENEGDADRADFFRLNVNKLMEDALHPKLCHPDRERGTSQCGAGHASRRDPSLRSG